MNKYPIGMKVIQALLDDEMAIMDVSDGRHGNNFFDKAAKIIERESGVAELIEALKEIAKYGKHHGGCCPYGCDTPHIASEVLKKFEGE